MKPSRRTGAAAVNRSARKAGIMASSNGSASAVPAPRKNVLTGKMLPGDDHVGSCALRLRLPHLERAHYSL